MMPLAWQALQQPGAPGGRLGAPQPAPAPVEWWADPAVLLALIVTLFAFVVFFGAFATITAVQARWRGYPFLVWLLTGLLGNPIFLLVLLGVMPDFRRRRLRERQADDLRRRLSGQPPPGAKPSAPRPAMQVDRSLGDEPTVLPERSLGDDETRL